MLWDALLFVGFIFLGLHTWVAMLLVVQLGLYFEGHTISRVIFILNNVFDAGTVVYLGLWGIQEGTGASTSSILGGYLAVGCILYGLSIYFWHVAVPEGGVEENIMNAPSSRFSPRLEMLSTNLDLDDRLMNNLSAQSMRAISNYLGSIRDAWSSRHSAVSLKSIVPTTNKDLQEDNKSINPEKPDGEVALAPASSYVCVADRLPREQWMAAPFIFLCLFFGFNLAITNWNLMTQRDVLAGLGDDEKDNIYLTIFTFMTPCRSWEGPLLIGQFSTLDGP
jgi:hypothetical protein